MSEIVPIAGERRKKFLGDAYDFLCRKTAVLDLPWVNRQVLNIHLIEERALYFLDVKVLNIANIVDKNIANNPSYEWIKWMVLEMSPEQLIQAHTSAAYRYGFEGRLSVDDYCAEIMKAFGANL